MTDTLLQQADRLAIQCRATLDSPHGSPLRSEKMISEHRQLVSMLEDLVEFTHTRESFISHLARLLKNLFEAFSTGTNGHRSWIRGIPQSGKTALILIHQFLQRHK